MQAAGLALTGTAIRRLSWLVATTLAAGCSAGGPARLMTWGEYRGLEHVTPYVLDLPCGRGRLVYVGSRHTNEVGSLSVAVIEALWSQVDAIRPRRGRRVVSRLSTPRHDQMQNRGPRVQ